MTNSLRPTPPMWLRLWHLSQAILFFGLLVSGLSMHYVDVGLALLPFGVAVKIHNFSGLGTILLWLIFAIQSYRSGTMQRYLKRERQGVRRVLLQVHYYAWGMFRGDVAPFPVGTARHHNPAQKISYAVVMYALMPLAAISGALLLFPWLAPERALGLPGLMPMALIHLAVSYLLSLFVMLHIYLSVFLKAH